MESPLVVNQYPKFSKEQILDIFKAAVPKNEFLLTLADFLPDIFSSDIVEPENFQQQPPDFNIADAILENIATPKPMRMVAQKRVYIPKAPFSSSGYADEPTHRVWYYLDEGHNIQGPFTSLEMDFWFDSGFFFNELLIRIKENNDFVKLVHLFGKTEIIQVAKPALLTPMGGHMLIDQAPLSAGILTAEPMSSGKGPALEKKQSIYTFGFDPDDNLLKDGENTQETSAETPIKLKNENEEETKSVEADEVKQPSICVNNTDLAEKEGEKDKEEKYKEIKDNKEAQEEANGQAKRSESNGQNNRHFLDVKQKEEKNLLSPSGYKKNQRGPESSKKKNSYVEVYEPKTSPCPDKSAKQQQDNRKNKGREQGQTMLQYVVKGEKKEEPEPVKEKREKNNNNNNKGGNSNNNHAKKSKQDLNERDNIAGTPGKKNQDMVIFVPKKKAEVTYTEKAKDTPEKIYVPKQQQYQPKEVNAVNVLPNLQPGFFQRKESDTFEVLKATSEYYQTGTTNSFPGQEASRQSLPPGLQHESGLEPVINGRNFMKKPKDRLRLVAHHQCDDYEKEQDRVVATSLGLLDLEDEAVVNKKPPVKSHFKTNSATPSPLIIDNQTVGKLYNFNEDLKYSSFSNQAENFPEKEC